MISKLRIPALLLTLIVIASSCDRDDEVSAIQNNNSVFPGDFLSEKKFKKLTIEVVYVSGQQPSATALNSFKTFLGARLNKSGGINITQRSVASPGHTLLSAEMIRELEKVNRQSVTDGDNITVFIYFADGDYSENSGNQKVLGLAYGASSICVFEKTVTELSGASSAPAHGALETIILSHEFGHLLGLVNNGTSMVAPHQDSAHSSHCTDTDCLMYYKAETNGVADILDGGAPTLDSFCLADLKAAGGK